MGLRVEPYDQHMSGPSAVEPVHLNVDQATQVAPVKPAALPHQLDTIGSYDDDAQDPITTIGDQHLRPVIEKPNSYCDAWARRQYEAWSKQQQLYSEGAELALGMLSRQQEAQMRAQKELSDLQGEMIDNSKKTSWATWINRMLFVGFIFSCLGSLFMKAYTGPVVATIVTETAKAAWAHLQKTLVIVQAGNTLFKMYFDEKGKQFAGDMQLKRHERKKAAEKATALINQSNKLNDEIQRIYKDMMRNARSISKATIQLIR